MNNNYFPETETIEVETDNKTTHGGCEISQHIAKNAIRFMQEHNITIKELAKKMEVSKDVATSMLYGNVSLKLYDLVMLEDALDIHLAFLSGGPKGGSERFTILIKYIAFKTSSYIDNNNTTASTIASETGISKDAILRVSRGNANEPYQLQSVSKVSKAIGIELLKLNSYEDLQIHKFAPVVKKEIQITETKKEARKPIYDDDYDFFCMNLQAKVLTHMNRKRISFADLAKKIDVPTDKIKKVCECESLESISKLEEAFNIELLHSVTHKKVKTRLEGHHDHIAEKLSRWIKDNDRSAKYIADKLKVSTGSVSALLNYNASSVASLQLLIRVQKFTDAPLLKI